MGSFWTDPLCALQGWPQGLSAPDLTHPPAWASPARPLMPEDDDMRRNPPCGLPMSEPPWRFWSVNKEGVSLTYALPVLSLMHTPQPSAQDDPGGGGAWLPSLSYIHPIPCHPVVWLPLSSCATTGARVNMPQALQSCPEEPDPFSQAQGAPPSLPGPSAGSLCTSQQGRPSRGVGSHWLYSRATCQWYGPVTGVGRGVGGFLSPERQAPHYVSIVALPASLSAVLRLILYIEA